MKPIDVTDGNINGIFASQKPLLLNFTAEWCGPCRKISPIVELIANSLNNTAIIGKLNIDQNLNTAARFGVKDFPTFLFFKHGKLLDRVSGVVPKSVIEHKVKSILQ